MEPSSLNAGTTIERCGSGTGPGCESEAESEAGENESGDCDLGERKLDESESDTIKRDLPSRTSIAHGIMPLLSVC